MNKKLLLVSVFLIQQLLSQEFDIKRLPYSNYIQRVDIVNVSSNTFISVSPLQPQQIDIFSVSVSSITSVKLVDKNSAYFNVMIINNSEDYSLLISTSATGSSFRLFPKCAYSTTAKSNIFGKMEQGSPITTISVIIER